MSTASTARPGRLGTAVQSRTLLQESATGAAAATLANAALWTGGHAAGVSFMVSSAFMTQVGIAAVVLTTLLTFAAGSGLLALATRRSRRSVHAVLITAALITVISAAAPLTAAQDTPTGILLATMHLVAGAAFLITARKVVPPVPLPGR
jgi:hypothetical protein